MSAGRPVALAELVQCDESDLEIVMPWTGPVIGEDGALVADLLPEKFYCATSVGWPKDGVADEAIAHNQQILATLMQLDGMLAMTVGVSANCWNVARNLVVWRDPAALREFLHTPAHLAAAERTKDLMWDWEGTGWFSTRESGLPDFAESRARLDGARAPTSDYASFD